MNITKFKRYELEYDINYDSCEFLIEKVLKKFKASIIENAADSIETIYCDILVHKKYKICIHYHYMVGVVVIALTKDSEPAAKEVADFMDAFIAGWIANKEKGD